MKKLFLVLLLFLLGVNGALFWQNVKAEGHAACPVSKKGPNAANVVLVPGAVVNIN